MCRLYHVSGSSDGAGVLFEVTSRPVVDEEFRARRHGKHRIGFMGLS